MTDQELFPPNVSWELHAPDGKQRYCRTCMFCYRYELNYWGTKVVHCCALQRDNHSKGGYKTIKVKSKACRNYQEH